MTGAHGWMKKRGAKLVAEIQPNSLESKILRGNPMNFTRRVGIQGYARDLWDSPAGGFRVLQIVQKNCRKFKTLVKVSGREEQQQANLESRLKLIT